MFRVDFKAHRIDGSIDDLYVLVGAPDKDAASTVVLSRTPYPITITRSIPVEDEFYGTGFDPIFGRTFYGAPRFPFYGFNPGFYPFRGLFRYF